MLVRGWSRSQALAWQLSRSINRMVLRNPIMHAAECDGARCNMHAQMSWQSICCRISQSHVCSLQPEMQTSVCWMHGTSTPTKSLRVHKIQTTSSACMLGFSHTGARTDKPFSTLNAAMSANLVRIKQLNMHTTHMHAHIEAATPCHAALEGPWAALGRDQTLQFVGPWQQSAWTSPPLR